MYDASIQSKSADKPVESQQQFSMANLAQVAVDAWKDIASVRTDSATPAQQFGDSKFLTIPPLFGDSVATGKTAKPSSNEQQRDVSLGEQRTGSFTPPKWNGTEKVVKDPGPKSSTVDGKPSLNHAEVRGANSGHSGNSRTEEAGSSGRFGGKPVGKPEHTGRDICGKPGKPTKPDFDSNKPGADKPDVVKPGKPSIPGADTKDPCDGPEKINCADTKALNGEDALLMPGKDDSKRRCPDKPVKGESLNGESTSDSGQSNVKKDVLKQLNQMVEEGELSQAELKQMFNKLFLKEMRNQGN